MAKQFDRGVCRRSAVESGVQRLQQLREWWETRRSAVGMTDVSRSRQQGNAETGTAAPWQAEWQLEYPVESPCTYRRKP
jgi:hypothetical protein